MKFIQQRSIKFLGDEVGLQGTDREVTRAKLEIGKGVGKLSKALTGSHPNLADRDSAVERLLRLQQGTAQGYRAVDALYVNCADGPQVQFSFKYLCSAGHERLRAFAPLLVKLYANPNSDLADKVRLTIWSIEVEIPKVDGTVQWWDLRELTVEQIKKLEHVLTQGTSQPQAPKTVVPAKIEPAPPVNHTADVTPEVPNYSPEPPIGQVLSQIEEYAFGAMNPTDDEDFSGF